jgi:tRNA pseudouridine13 synthase
MELESRVGESFQGLASGMNAWRVKADRRRFRILPGDLSWELGDGSLRLAFTLPAGSFATAVLREFLDYAEMAENTGD